MARIAMNRFAHRYRMLSSKDETLTATVENASDEIEEQLDRREDPNGRRSQPGFARISRLLSRETYDTPPNLRLQRLQTLTQAS